MLASVTTVTLSMLMRSIVMRSAWVPHSVCKDIAKLLKFYLRLSSSSSLSNAFVSVTSGARSVAEMSLHSLIHLALSLGQISNLRVGCNRS